MIRFVALAAFVVTSWSLEATAAEPFVPASGIDGAGLGLAEPALGRAWVESTAFFDSDGGVLAPVAGGGIFAADQVEIELGVPFAVTTGDDREADIGNPYAGVQFVHMGADLRVRAGLRLAAPVADSDSFLSAPLFLAGVTRGFGTIYLYAVDALGIVPNGRLEVDVAEPLVFTADAGLPILVAVRNRNDTDTLLELAPGLAVRPTDAVVLGLRAPVAILLSGGGDDRAQVSLEPFIRGQIGRGFLSARFLYNIDEPLGPSFDEGRVWNVGLAGGFAF